MPTYYKRYPKYRRKYYPKKGSTSNWSSEQKKSIKRMINKEIAPELKYFNSVVLQSTNSFATSGSTSTIYDLCVVPQSSTPQQQDFTRIGDQIKLKSLNVKLCLEALGSFTSGAIRVVIFQWKSDNINFPTLSQIYMASVTGGIDSLSNFQPDTIRSGDFVVLYDRLVSMASATETDMRTFDIKVPLKWAKKELTFTSGGTNGANHILMIINADKTAVSPDGVRYSFNSRMNFTDA